MTIIKRPKAKTNDCITDIFFHPFTVHIITSSFSPHLHTYNEREREKERKKERERMNENNMPYKTVTVQILKFIESKVHLVVVLISKLT